MIFTILRNTLKFLPKHLKGKRFGIVFTELKIPKS